MRIGILSPSGGSARTGNAITANRYAHILRELGHSARIITGYAGENFDLLVALHARKSGRGALAFTQAFPHRPLVVVLTGTDLYRDLPRSRLAQRTLAAATRVVTLQSHALRLLSPAIARKGVAILQSAQTPAHVQPVDADRIVFAIVGHLRPEKDSLRAGFALRLLPRSLPLCIIQIGAALDARYAARAGAMAAREPRYFDLGEVSSTRARALLAGSDALILSSRMEGGANVACEAIAAGVPILASRISGNLGILGPRYSGYVAVGDTPAWAGAMRRFVTEPRFRARLRAEIVALQPLVKPACERIAWAKLLRELRA